MVAKAFRHCWHFTKALLPNSSKPSYNHACTRKHAHTSLAHMLLCNAPVCHPARRPVTGRMKAFWIGTRMTAEEQEWVGCKPWQSVCHQRGRISEWNCKGNVARGCVRQQKYGWAASRSNYSLVELGRLADKQRRASEQDAYTTWASVLGDERDVASLFCFSVHWCVLIARYRCDIYDPA